MNAERWSFGPGLKIAAGAISLTLIAGAICFIGSKPQSDTDSAAEGLAMGDTPTGSRASHLMAQLADPVGSVPAPAPRSRIDATSRVADPLAGQTRSAGGASSSMASAGGEPPRLHLDQRIGAAPVGGGDEARILEEQTQSGAFGLTTVFNATEVDALSASATPAEDVTGVGDSQQTMEEALLAGDAKAKDPAAPQATARNAMDRLIGAFVTERDEETKQDLLASGAELARSSGQSVTRFLHLALQPQQPLDVQQQALHLAAASDPAIVEKVAANPAHPLHLEADAFMREKRIATKIHSSARAARPAAQTP